MNTESEILDYITREETAGALLLTGEWGCGKTYLIKEIAQKLNKGKKYCIAVISLFGINNTEQLKEKVKDEFLQLSLSNAGKLASQASKALDLTRKIAEAANENLQNSSVSTAAKGVGAILSINPADFISVKNKIGKKQFVLIFDDFERCKIDKKVDLMGTINDYTENRHIKTVIVAAENKIVDDDYKEFKEKVISSTIQIKSDYSNIIKNMVSNYKNTSNGYSQFLKDNVDFIISAFRDSKSENIRYVKSALYDFERVYKVWSSERIGIDNMPQILYSFIAVSIEYKLGIYVYDEKYNSYAIRANKQQIDNNGEPAKKVISQVTARLMIINKYRDYTFSNFFTSLSRWIVNGIWNERDFIDELMQKYPAKKLNDMEKFLLYYPLKLDSTTIMNGLNKSLEAAYNGELTCDQLISLIKNIHILRELNESIVSIVDYSKIENGFDNRIVKIREGKIIEPERHSSLAYDSHIDHLAMPIWNKIFHLKDKYIAWDGYEEISNILKEETHDWAIIRKYNTIDVFDDSLFKLFVQKYNNSSHYDKKGLIRMLCELKLDDSNCSTESQIQESKNNLEKVLCYIREKINEKPDDIILLSVLKSCEKELKELLNESDTNE